VYWYYKYPLYVLLAAVLLGILYLAWRQLPGEVADSLRVGGDETADTEDGGGHTPVGGSPRTPGTNRGIPAPSATLALQIKGAKEQLANDSPLAARTLARKVLASEGVRQFSDLWFEAAEVASQANTELFNSDAPAPEKVRYEVQTGDNLVNIAKAHSTTVQALQRGNSRLGPDSAKIFPGMILHIYRGTWRIAISKERFVLLLYDGDLLFKLYHVGIGRQDRTPVGTFKIINKLAEPAWTPPGKVIPYGDPENVLGTRWLGLQATGDTDPTLKGYGIHGTWRPESIGKAESEGCVRLRNDDVDELFDVVPPGIPVLIEGE